MLTCVLSLRVSTTPFQTLDTAIEPLDHSQHGAIVKMLETLIKSHIE